MSDLTFCPFANKVVPTSLVEDEHPAILAPLHDYMAFFLDKALEMGKPYLHPLVNDLFDQHQVLGNFWNM